MMKAERGFSLIEMLVVLLIGMLIVLMAGQVYVMSMRHALSQERMANGMNQQIFGIEPITSHLRLAGLGINEMVLAEVAPQGILVKEAQLSKQNHQTTSISRYLTRIDHTNKKSYVSLPSEQLTIIYRAPQDMWDCEGEIALGPRRVRLSNGEMAQVDGQVVIERYFVQHDDGVMNLRCDGARFVPERIVRDGTRDRRFERASTSFINAIIDADAKGVQRANTIRGFGGSSPSQGEIVASNVEGLWVQFGVQTTEGMRWMNLSEYLTQPMSPIVMMNVAILSHSGMILTDGEKQVRSFEVFGRTLYLTDTAPNYDRQLHHLSIRLRNVIPVGEGR